MTLPLFGRFTKSKKFFNIPPSLKISVNNGGVAGSTTTVPEGLGFIRGACIDSVQTGTETLEEIASAANVLRYGRALDAWEIGLVLEKAATNRVANSKDYSSAGYTTLGSYTLVSATESDPKGTNTASRLTAAAGTNGRYTGLTGQTVGTKFANTQWMRPQVAGTDVALTTGGNPVTEAVLSAPASWKRYTSAPSTVIAGGAMNLLCIDTRAWTSISAGARDWVLYAPQIEAGSYPTEFIPTTAGAATRLETYLYMANEIWSKWIAPGGIFAISFRFRPKGARTEYDAETPYFLYTTNGQSVSFVPSTGVMTLTINGASNTVTLPAWSRYDLVELYISMGGNSPTIVRYRLNNGSTISLSVTGSALGPMVFDGGYILWLMSTNIGNQLSCWLYDIQLWRNRLPQWAV